MKKRLIALLACLCIVVSSVPVGAFADDNIPAGGDEENIVQQEKSQEDETDAENEVTEEKSASSDENDAEPQDKSTTENDADEPTDLAEDELLADTEAVPMMLLSAAPAAADTASPADYFNFDKNTGKIKGLKGEGLKAEEIIIPEEIDGVPVKEIYTLGWSAIKNLKKITLPASAEIINPDFALNANNLLDIVVSEGNANYTSAGGALLNADKTVLLEVPAAKTEYTIPDTVTTIGKKAFEKSNITSLTLPAGLEVIEEAAFMKAHLTSIALPEGLLKIGDSAFKDSYLTGTFNIPASVTEITKGDFGYNFLGNTPGVTGIEVAEGNTVYYSDNGMLYKDTTLLLCPEGLAADTYTLKEGTTAVDDYAMSNCFKVDNLILPDGLKKIGTKAFMACKFASIHVPNSVTEVGEEAFLSSGIDPKGKIIFGGTEMQWNKIKDKFPGVTVEFAPPAKPTVYKVTFKVVNGTWAEGGKMNKVVNVTCGENNKGTLTDEQIPKGMKPNAGYEGGAWDVTPNKEVTANATYSYIFTKSPEPETKEFTISFNAQGGSAVSSVKTVNKKLATLPTTTKDGFTFDGWYTSAQGGTKVTTSKVYEADTTLYAHWTKNEGTTPEPETKEFTISFNTQGGSAVSSVKTVNKKLATLPTTTKDGFTFDGWYTSAQGGTKVTTSKVYEADTTLYAHWTKNEGTTPEPETKEFTVSFNTQGGSAVSSVKTVNKKLSTLPTTTKDGFTFDGWYTSAQGGTKVTTSKVYEADTTLYAHWTEKAPVITNATVTFKVVNGTWANGSSADKNVTVKLTNGKGRLSSTDIPTGMRAKKGYEGGSWNERPKSEVTGDVTYTYTFTKKADVITSATVTFKVVNGTWANGSSADKNVTVKLTNGRGTLSYSDIPTGMRAKEGYNKGAWDVRPDRNVTGDATYTYTFTKSTDTVSEALVTFKVVNGTWQDKTTKNKTVKVTLVNGRGNLPSSRIPTGMIANEGYENGRWNRTPSETVTGDVTYTYTFTEKAKYPITVKPVEGGNGTFEVSLNNARMGQVITIKINPKNGFRIESITVTKKNAEEAVMLTALEDGDIIPVAKVEGEENLYQFVMPDGAVDIDVTFTEETPDPETPDPERPDPERPEPERPRPTPDHKDDDDDEDESIKKPTIVRPSVVITPSMNPPTGSML